MCWRGAPERPAHARRAVSEGTCCQEPGSGLRSLLSILVQRCSPIVFIGASSELLMVIKSLGLVSQLSCQLAEWPWASHLAASTQVASSVKGGSRMNPVGPFPAPRFHTSVNNPRDGMDRGASWNFLQEYEPGRGKQQHGEGGEQTAGGPE